MRLSRSPTLRSLRAFCVAARTRSFRVAAEEIFLTPSAVSHQIKELEDLLGVPLFERKTRSVELTAAGQRLFEEVAPLLEALDRSLTRVARRSRRRLRVQAPPFFASELLLPRLASFCAEHPNVDIQLDSQGSQGPANLPTVDVSVLLADSPPAGQRAERLFPVTLTAVCAREHAPAVARLGPRVFDEFALITHKSQLPAWGEWAAAAGLDTSAPRHLIELDSVHGVVRAAEAGLGIALVPEPLCARWFDRGALVRIYPVEAPSCGTYFVVCRPRDAERPEVAALVHWLVTEFRPAPEQSSPVVQKDLIVA
jgi:LysR family glycine cleavage system transcriptional activator